jgi:hypothetical membrane protein
MIDSVEPSREQGYVGQVWSRWFALTGVIAPVFLVLVFTLDGFMRPGYSQLQQTISSLGRGQNAWILNTTLTVFGLLLLLFVVGLYPWLAQIMKRQPVASCILLTITGLAAVCAGLFPEKDPAQPKALHGVIHSLAFLIAFILLIIAIFIIGLGVRRVPKLHRYSWYSLITGAITLVIFVLYFLLQSFHVSYVGLMERILVIEAFAWYAVTGWTIFALDQ